MEAKGPSFHPKDEVPELLAAESFPNLRHVVQTSHKAYDGMFRLRQFLVYATPPSMLGSEVAASDAYMRVFGAEPGRTSSGASLLSQSAVFDKAASLAEATALRTDDKLVPAGDSPFDLLVAAVASIGSKAQLVVPASVDSADALISNETAAFSGEVKLASA